MALLPIFVVFVVIVVYYIYDGDLDDKLDEFFELNSRREVLFWKRRGEERDILLTRSREIDIWTKVLAFDLYLLLETTRNALLIFLFARFLLLSATILCNPFPHPREHRWKLLLDDESDVFEREREREIRYFCEKYHSSGINPLI